MKFRHLIAACGALALAATGIGAANAAQAASASPAPIPAVSAVNAGKHLSFPGNDGRPHEVSWDKYTFKVDGEPLHIYSGEIHYWRLPSPNQWRDIMQKMRAGGFNAISLYFFWGYHQDREGGPYDFTGVKDLDKLMTMAAEEGLYVIARPGPYINAEISMGGLPAWLTNSGANLRSTEDPKVLAQSLDWIHNVNEILKRHQVTDGGGSMLMYQSENEMFFQADTQVKFQQALTTQIRQDGITVPLFHNDWAPNGQFSGEKMRAAGLDFYAYDDYPIRFDCGGMRFELGDHEAKVRGFAPDSPIFVAEGQGGAFSPWGAKFQASDCIRFADDNFIRQWGATNIANGVTAFNYYMIFGGTNWGWTGSPHSGFTSYDYGAGITEDRALTGKFSAQKELGYFQVAAPAFARSEPIQKPQVDLKFGSAIVKGYQRLGVDPEASVTGGGMRTLVFRHVSSNQTATSRFSTSLQLSGPNGEASFARIPADPNRYLTVNGRDALMFTADQLLGDFDMYYTTSELFANEQLASSRFVALTGTAGDYGETMLRFDAEPLVQADQGVDWKYDPATGQLLISYVYGDQTVKITDATDPSRVLELRILSRSELGNKWLLAGPDSSNATQPKLWVEGTDVVRTVEYRDGVAYLNGSMNASHPVTVRLPEGVGSLVFNGEPVGSANESGAVSFTARGPLPVAVPALQWRSLSENPESAVDFDDSNWTLANAKTTENPKQGPGLVQGVVLDANYYGYHEGDVWYRAHFKSNVNNPLYSFVAFGAEASNFLVWVNGTYVGAYDANGILQIVRPPWGLVKKGEDVTVAVLLRNNGQRVDWQNFGESQHAMGIHDATLLSRGEVTWKIMGAKSADTADKARTTYNNGGLYGEREGWYLPGFDDSSWAPARTLRASEPGVTWFRSDFNLNVPAGQDVAFRLNVNSSRFGNLTDHSRTVMFINGWNMGTWVGDVGPQKSFTIPAGFLNPNGRNEIAIALTAEEAGAGPESVTLSTVMNQTGGVAWEQNAAPGYAELKR